MVTGALVARLPHLLRQFGIGHHLIDGGGHIGHELVRIGGRARAVMQLFDRHQIAGLAVDHDLGDASGGGSDHRQPARHGLKIHNAQRLVNRWADERVTTMFQRVQLRLGQHFLNPDDIAARGVQLGERLLDFLCDLGGVGSAGAQHHLNARVNQMQGLEQIRQALLPRDAPHEQQRGLAAVDVVAVEHLPALVVGRGRGEITHGDAVVHHHHLGRVDIRVGGENVLAHAARHRDDAVGMFVGVAFGPGTQVVAATELFALPRAERFERMGGDHHRHLVQLLRETPGQTGIPCVHMHQIRIDIIGDLQVDSERLQCAVGVSKLSGGIVADQIQRALGIAGDGGNIGAGARAVERAHGHVDAFGQHAGQLLGMHTGTTIDMRRVFAGENIDLHRPSPYRSEQSDTTHCNPQSPRKTHNRFTALQSEKAIQKSASGERPPALEKPAILRRRCRSGRDWGCAWNRPR